MRGFSSPPPPWILPLRCNLPLILTKPCYLKIFLIQLELATGKQFWRAETILFQDLNFLNFEHILWSCCRRKISNVETFLFHDLTFPLLKHIIRAHRRQNISNVKTFLFHDLIFSLLKHILVLQARHRQKISNVETFYSMMWHFKCWNHFISWCDISFIKTHNMSPRQLKIWKVYTFLFQDPVFPLLKCIIWARHSRKIVKIETFLFQDLPFLLLKLNNLEKLCLSDL